VSAPLSVTGRSRGCSGTTTELGCVILLALGFGSGFFASATRDLAGTPFGSLLRMPAFWVAASAVALPGSFVLGWLVRRWSRARAGRVTFLESRIAFTKPGTSFTVPWSHLAAYDDGSPAHVLLLRKGERLASPDLGVPTVGEKEREAVLELLVRRGIPGDGTRLVGACEPEPVTEPRLVLRPRVPPWVVRVGSITILGVVLIVLESVSRRPELFCVAIALLMPVVLVMLSQSWFDAPARVELHDDRIVLHRSWLGRRTEQRRVELVYEDLESFDSAPRRRIVLRPRPIPGLSRAEIGIPVPTAADKETARAFLLGKGLADSRY
jgi:hypothetical protein